MRRKDRRASEPREERIHVKKETSRAGVEELKNAFPDLWMNAGEV